MLNSSQEQFMLRKQRHRRLVDSGLMPTSSREMFVVPCLDRSLGFRTNEYAKHSEQLEDFIDRVSFERFIRNANRIVDKQLLVRAEKQSKDFFPYTSLFLKISVFIGIVTFSVLGVLVYLDLGESTEQIILNVTIALIVLSIAISAFCPIYLYLHEYTQYQYEAIIKAQLDHLAQEENDKNAKEGRDYLTWEFEKSFFWVALHIDVENFESRSKQFVHRFEEPSQDIN